MQFWVTVIFIIIIITSVFIKSNIIIFVIMCNKS